MDYLMRATDRFWTLHLVLFTSNRLGKLDAEGDVFSEVTVGVVET